ncbi:MAG TPA: DUF2254 domain-containing protein [Opitutaceae bacterium]|nr:DUF2254 domain-containing protein [Opitutaceae bacterium]
MSKFRYLLGRLMKQLWVRPTIMSLLAIGWVTLAYGIQYVTNDTWPFDIEKATLTNLFAILASSMLTVATFAVSALVAAFSGVSSSSTPRARVLVMADTTAQTALASFVGAFIYAVVALVALSTLSYGTVGRFGLFVGFVIAVSFVLMSFLRWVALVSNLGGLDDTIDRAEKAALEVFSSPAAIGGIGGREYGDDVSMPTGLDFMALRIGYLCHVDTTALNELAERLNATIWLRVRPGAFVDTARQLVTVVGVDRLDEEDEARLRDAFTIQPSRDLSVDPRFALIVLSEIADRSLSASTNDTGTSIRVLGVQLRLFARWVETRRLVEEGEVEFPHVNVPRLAVSDLLDDAFMATARSGAPYVEVALRLQKCFRTLALLGREDLRHAAVFQAELALAQALEKISLDHYRKRLLAVAGQAS